MKLCAPKSTLFVPTLIACYLFNAARKSARITEYATCPARVVPSPHRALLPSPAKDRDSSAAAPGNPVSLGISQAIADTMPEPPPAYSDRARTRARHPAVLSTPGDFSILPLSQAPLTDVECVDFPTH